MRVSKRVLNIEPSLTRQMFNLAKNYDDVIDLTLGDPDLAPPEEIRMAAYRAIECNKLHYSANAGVYEAREAIAERIAQIWNRGYDPEKNIVVTVGGMEALFLSLSCMIEKGDEVIVLAPYYVNYLQMIEICGGKPIIVETYDLEKGLYINEEILDEAITEKTVGIIVNSPNNPTGDIMSQEMLKRIAKIVVKYDLFVISDEVYRALLYDGRVHESILQFPEVANRTIVIDSLSKEYSMTGWRIGYAFGPEEIISNMIKLQENVAACATVSSQYALIEAYKNKISNQYIVDEFRKRRDYFYESVLDLGLLKSQKPKATFYIFVDISQTGYQSVEFAYKLLADAHVAVVPGVVYGDAYDNYVRVAYTKNVEVLKGAVERIQTFLGGIGEDRRI